MRKYSLGIIFISYGFSLMVMKGYPHVVISIGIGLFLILINFMFRKKL